MNVYVLEWKNSNCDYFDACYTETETETFYIAEASPHRNTIRTCVLQSYVQGIVWLVTFLVIHSIYEVNTYV